MISLNYISRIAGVFLPALALAQPQSAIPAVADVCVYGGTASGVMAAVAATREGKCVIVPMVK
jgi:NADPH-dependent 2,4-dienoyl-CoA reductase/sulfur reductase-like enzyme